MNQKKKSEIAIAIDEGNIFQTTTKLKDDLQNEIEIPGGFKVPKESGTKVEEGIVIEDNVRNQFVWIPVGTYKTTKGDKLNNLSRRSFSENGAEEVTEDNGDGVVDGTYYGEGDSRSVAADTISTFKSKSISNKGFYIGRFEAGTEAERTSLDDQLTTPLVQKNKNAYVYIQREQAMAQSGAMYELNSSVTSELVTSYAWDTALNFICQNNDEGYVIATTNGNSYGNINTNLKTLTGNYEQDKYCNIYDMVGNCTEWTPEYSTNVTNDRSYPTVTRGGNYASLNCSASIRISNNTIYNVPYVTFRIQLYVN